MRILHVIPEWTAAEAVQAGASVDNLIESLRRRGVAGDVLPVPRAWRRAVKAVRAAVRLGRYDLIHAHQASSALAASMQRTLPVVAHLHDELQDGHSPRLGRWAARMAPHVLVCDALSAVRVGTRHVRVVPIGVDSGRFFPVARTEACRALDLDPAKKWVLFAGDPAAASHDYPLFCETVRRIARVIPEATALSLYDRPVDTHVELMNAADLLLVTARAEASPRAVKEALLCNLPIVSTRVGDVSRLTAAIHPTTIERPDADALAEAAIACLRSGTRSNGRIREPQLNLARTATALIGFYDEVLQHSGATLALAA
jgi:teichuronic acid biosynthesis glycosyltransferase TuaC